MKRIAVLAMLILLSQMSFGAILHGTIYDTKFNKLNDVIVEINSTPPQIFVSKEGQYSFVLDPGPYKITAKYQLSDANYLYSESNVTIARNGYFLVDLFLRPARKIEMPTGAVVGTNVFLNYSILASVSVTLLIILGFSVYKLRSSNPQAPEFDDYTNKVLNAVREEGGRTTQKDIRKKIALSEGKISLIISDLENKGILKRIKKGRGNIIILSKR